MSTTYVINEIIVDTELNDSSIKTWICRDSKEAWCKIHSILDISVDMAAVMELDEAVVRSNVKKMILKLRLPEHDGGFSRRLQMKNGQWSGMVISKRQQYIVTMQAVS